MPIPPKALTETKTALQDLAARAAPTRVLTAALLWKEGGGPDPRKAKGSDVALVLSDKPLTAADLKVHWGAEVVASSLFRAVVGVTDDEVTLQLAKDSPQKGADVLGKWVKAFGKEHKNDLGVNAATLTNAKVRTGNSDELRAKAGGPSDRAVTNTSTYVQILAALDRCETEAPDPSVTDMATLLIAEQRLDEVDRLCETWLGKHWFQKARGSTKAKEIAAVQERIRALRAQFDVALKAVAERSATTPTIKGLGKTAARAAGRLEGEEKGGGAAVLNAAKKGDPVLPSALGDQIRKGAKLKKVAAPTSRFNEASKVWKLVGPLTEAKAEAAKELHAAANQRDYRAHSLQRTEQTLEDEERLATDLVEGGMERAMVEETLGIGVLREQVRVLREDHATWVRAHDQLNRRVEELQRQISEALDGSDLEEKELDAYFNWSALAERARRAAEDADDEAVETEQRAFAVWRQNALDRIRHTDPTKAYKVGRRLGQGGMGAVDLLESDDPTIPPLIFKQSLNNDLREMQHEATMYQRLDGHPNIARCLGIQEVRSGTGTARGLVMENVGGGDFRNLLKDLQRFAKANLITQEEYWGAAAHVMRGSLKGLKHMHDAGLSHNDLKPMNICIDLDGTPKLIDMGLVMAEGNMITGGTPTYTAGKRFAQHEGKKRSPSVATFVGFETADEASDLYSMGRILRDVGRKAYGGKEADAKEVAEAASTSFVTLLRKLTSGEKLDRGDIRDALDHPFLADAMLDEEAAKAAIKKVFALRVQHPA